MKLLLVWRSPQAENPDACHAGLGITAKNIEIGLRQVGLPVESAPVVDGFYLRDGLKEGVWGRTTHVVMLAPFFDNEFLRTLCEEFPQINFFTTYHSNIPFLSQDRWALRMLMSQLKLEKTLRNFHVAGNCEKFTQATGVVPLLNIYPQREIPAKRPLRDPLLIGAYGASRVLKNLPTAAWAASLIQEELGRPVIFEINAGREEGEGSKHLKGICEEICRGLCVNFNILPWQEWEEFRSHLQYVDLILQPSFTESFNNVVADGISQGVPSVVGPAIHWVPGWWHANPDSAREIALVGLRLLADEDSGTEGYLALEKYNRAAIETWRNLLTL
jgi:hypothetical protein